MAKNGKESTMLKYGVVYVYDFNGVDYVRYDEYTALYAAYEKLLNESKEKQERENGNRDKTNS